MTTTISVINIMFTTTTFMAIADDEAEVPPDPMTRLTTVAVVLD